MCVHESNLRYIWFGRLHYYALRCKPSPGSCDPESEVKWGQPGSDDFGIMTILVRIIWDWGLLLIGLIKPSIYSPCNPGSSSHNRIIPLIITHKDCPYLQSYLQWPYLSRVQRTGSDLGGLNWTKSSCLFVFTVWDLKDCNRIYQMMQFPAEKMMQSGKI